MKKWRRNSGFTMAELLIVVAILGVLAGVSFVAVQNHQKSLTQAEMDSIAKEIFVAAQNHLTMAQSQNYLGVSNYGSPESTDSSIYYLIKNQGSNVLPEGTGDFYDQILPFGSIDETVRAGNYIIRYQPKSALVLDVFYCAPNGRYSGELDENDYSGLLANKENKAYRSSYKGSIVGWYGGEEAADLPTGAWLEEPQIEIVNAEKLLVKVTDTNDLIADTDNDITLQLIITGLNIDGTETTAKKAIEIRANGVKKFSGTGGVYTITLDDITQQNNHFAKGFDALNGFIPGQNLKIQAVTYHTSSVSNIAYSDAEVTNSLFEGITKNDDGSITAYINNIRHLENLDSRISNIDASGELESGTILKCAVQTSDMSWEGFKTYIAANTPELTVDTVQVYTNEETPQPSGEGLYMPVSPDYVLDYDGKNYNISDVKVNYDGNAGLFGTLSKSGSKVSNLALIDLDIKTPEASTGNAGALAGSITGTYVTNVLAYNKNTSATATNVTAENGSAGGLIGSMSGGTVNKCAAALIVNGKDAGGLIGTSSDGTVTASYSGGHTRDAEYSTEKYNVTSEASDKNAGGLIGNAGNTTISYCYSTCSAAGAIAGGLVGEATGSISGSYATGLVRSTAAIPVEGAFAGKHESGTLSGNHYFEIINERQETDGGFSYLTALGKGQSDSGITAIDETAATYNAFCWGENDCPWEKAVVYDKKLIEYYGKTTTEVDSESGDRTKTREAQFSLKTVAQLGATLKTSDSDETEYFVTTHYGDWPAPEIFVFNTATTPGP